MSTDPNPVGHFEFDNCQHALKTSLKKMGQLGPDEQAFWERRRRLGLGVGLDEDSNLVYAKDLPEAREP